MNKTHKSITVNLGNHTFLAKKVTGQTKESVSALKAFIAQAKLNTGFFKASNLPAFMKKRIARENKQSAA